MTYLHHHYSALFPATYSNIPSRTRRCSELEFPVVRLMGPLWSFGFRVTDMGPAELTPTELPEKALYNFRLMHELSDSEADPNHDYDDLRPPTLFRVQVDKTFTTEEIWQKINGAYEGFSCLSLVAVKSFNNLVKKPDSDGFPWRKRLRQHCQPTSDGDPVVVEGELATTELIVAPFGSAPPPHQNDDSAYLPAMQLLRGRVVVHANADYLARIRHELDLLQGLREDWPDLLVLLPDGFALYGAARLPWLPHDSEIVRGWFKATTRMVPGETTKWRPVLRPWAAPGLLANGWDDAFKELSKKIEALGRLEIGPRWLDISADEALTPEDFYWPSGQHFPGHKPSEPEKADFLLHRRAMIEDTSEIFLDASGLIAQLAYRPDDQPAQTALTIGAESFHFFGTPEQMTIATNLVPGTEEDGARDVDVVEKLIQRADHALRPLRALYTYVPERAGESPTMRSERLTFPSGAVLALPLVETAERLREELDLAEPGREDPVGLVWAFLALTDGWLHLPLPNASLGGLSRLLDSADAAEARADAGTADGGTTKAATAAGALGFVNRPDAAGYDDQQRHWSFGLSSPETAELHVAVSRDSDAQILGATVALGGGFVTVEGLLPLTPFRQTPWRMLPEAEDRALAAVSLNAVSPELLRGIEERMWLQAGRAFDGGPGTPKNALRMRAILSDLEIIATCGAGDRHGVRLSGTLELDVLFRVASEEGKLAPDAGQMRPWLWLRHRCLPTVQTLPLAVAGEARSRPSGSRELAPLRRAAPTDGRLVYTIPSALDMARSAQNLRMDGTWQRPTQDASWRDEIGMAILSLPSVTAFPGLEARPALSRLRGTGLVWANPATADIAVGTEVELRHDLAYRDEFYAHANLPRKDGKPLGTDTVLEAPAPLETGGLFRPRSDNGPDGLQSTRDIASVWQEPWREANRKSALAATDDRAMVCERDAALWLTGLFGEEDFEVRQVTVSEAIVIDSEGDSSHPFADETDTEILDAIGSLLIDADKLAPMSGLPNEADLIGLTGDFARAADDGSGNEVLVTFGTASLNAGELGFLDQRGLRYDRNIIVGAIGGDHGGAEVVRYAIRSGAALHGRYGAFKLLSLDRPISAGALRFWAADVPIDAETMSGHQVLGLGSDADRANSAAFDLNHLLGFRWSLARADMARMDGLIPVEGLLFEPLRLASIDLEDTGAPRRIEIAGTVRLDLQPQGATDQRAPAPGGEIRLVLTRDEGTTSFRAALEMPPGDGGAPIVWTLGDPDITSFALPRLEIPTLPPLGGAATATLIFQVDGLTHRIPLDLRRDPSGTITGAWIETADAMADALAVRQVDLATEWDARDDTLRLTELTAELGASFSQPGERRTPGATTPPPIATIALSLQANLLTGEIRLHSGAALTLPGIGEIAIDAWRKTGHAKNLDRLVDLAGGFLGLAWTVAAGTEPFLDALTIASGTGTLAAAVEPVAHTAGQSAHFLIRDTRIEGIVAMAADPLTSPNTPTLEASAAELSVAIDPVAGTLRLDGTLDLTNAFAWPAFPAPEFVDAVWVAHELMATDAIAVRHRTVLRFRAQPIDLGRAAPSEGLTLPAIVSHELLGLADDPVTWSSYQLVRLRSLSALAQELREIAASHPPVQLEVTRALGYLGISDPAELGLEDLSVEPLIFHRDAAHHAALSGRLSDALLDVLDPFGGGTPPRGAVIEFSGHYQLSWRSDPHQDRDTRDHTVLGLPGVAFLQPKDQGSDLGETVWSLFEGRLSENLTLQVPRAEFVTVASLSPATEAERAAAVERLRELLAKPGIDPGTVPARLLIGDDELERWHQPVFQSHVLMHDESGFLRLAAPSYPAVPIGLVLADLARRNIAGALEAFGFAQSGRLERADLMLNPSGEIPEYTQESMANAMRHFLQRLGENMLAAPDSVLALSAAEPFEPGAVLTLHALNRTGHRVDRIARAERGKPALGQLRMDVDWATRTLQRLAPWARIGLLSIAPSGGSAVNRQADPQRAGLVDPEQIPATRPIAEVVLDRPLPVQCQFAPQLSGPRALDAQALPGFRPLAVAAGLYASEDAFAHGSSTEGPRLTATGAETAWVLAGGAAPVLEPAGERAARAFWMTDRMRTAYRQATSSREVGHPPLRPTLPPAYHAALPRGLLPAPAGPVPALLRGEDRSTEASLSQHVLPGYAETARISARAGIWASVRVGVLQQDRAGPGALSVSEIPVHLRTPRPPLLAVNDRPRASSHEEAHMALARSPEVILHGPRARRAGTGAEPVGLDRRPRSLWATVVRLSAAESTEKLAAAALEQGLLTPGWNGAVRFAEVAAFGSQPGLWRVAPGRVVLVARGVRYAADHAESRELLDARGFTGFADPDGVPLQAVLPSLPPATTVELIADVAVDGNGPRLERQFRMTLIASGSGLARLEIPAYVRFDDPEYNDRLDGLAKLDRMPEPNGGPNEFIFAADRPDVRIRDRVEFAVGVRPGQPGSETERLFFPAEFLPHETFAVYAERHNSGADQRVLGIGFARRRVGNVNSTPLTIVTDQRPVPNDENLDLFQPRLTGISEFVAFNHDFSTLVVKDRSEQGQGPVLVPGDQVEVRLYLVKDRIPVGVAKLTFDVVTRPLLPSNPSAFGLLAYCAAEANDDFEAATVPARATVPLYASGPPATVIELIDPRDLIDGIVRRRALYQWRTFLPRAERDRLRFAIQKINAVGGTWIASDLRREWQRLPAALEN